MVFWISYFAFLYILELYLASLFPTLAYILICLDTLSVEWDQDILFARFDERDVRSLSKGDGFDLGVDPLSGVEFERS